MRNLNRREMLLRSLGLLGVALPIAVVPAMALTPTKPTAEMGLLGMLILSERWRSEVIRPIRTSMRFRERRNKLIFDAIYRVAGPVDLVVLSDRLERDRLLGDVGGREYLATLVMAAPSPETLERNLDRDGKQRA